MPLLAGETLELLVLIAASLPGVITYAFVFGDYGTRFPKRMGVLVRLCKLAYQFQ